MPVIQIISDNDIEKIYKTTPIKRVDVLSVCDTEELQKTVIDIFDKDNTQMNKEPIHREYHTTKSLKSYEGSGKVAEHKLFVLNDNQKGKGIAKKLHDKEIQIYVNNEFVEIHLHAAWDGIFIWDKLGFKYVNPGAYEPIVYSRWREYFLKAYTQENLDKTSKYDILLKYGSIKTVPEKYKKGFGTWLLSEGKNFSVPMYKRVG